MCILIAKPSGAVSPDEKTFRTCFENNNDGAGISVARENAIQTIKGLMTIQDFLTAFKALNIQESDSCLFHFRIATSGQTSRGNTHPFPIAKKPTKLKRTLFSSPAVFAHNGILKMPDNIVLSDSQVFVQTVLFPLWGKIERKTLNKTLQLIATSSYSRFAILESSRTVTMYGAKWIEDKKVFYSNDGYKAVKPKFSLADWKEEEDLWLKERKAIHYTEDLDDLEQDELAYEKMLYRATEY